MRVESNAEIAEVPWASTWSVASGTDAYTDFLLWQNCMVPICKASESMLCKLSAWSCGPPAVGSRAGAARRWTLKPEVGWGKVGPFDAVRKLGRASALYSARSRESRLVWSRSRMGVTAIESLLVERA